MADDPTTGESPDEALPAYLMDLEDEDLDDLLDEWAQVDAAAAEILARAWPAAVEWTEPPVGVDQVLSVLRERVGNGLPWGYFAPDLGAAEHDPVGTWLDCLNSTIEPLEDPTAHRGLDPGQAASIAAAEHADWLAIVLGSARRGVGALVDADAAYRDLMTMDEIDGAGEVEDPEDLRAALDRQLLVLAPLWQALGVLDEDSRLTELGRWGLPKALHTVWQTPGVEGPVEPEPSSD